MPLLDFLFPKHCVQCKKFGSYLCPTCFSYVTFAEIGFCTVCQKAAIGGLTHPVCRNSLTIDGVFSSLVYTGVVKKLVYQFKYKPYLTSLRPLLTDFFYEGLIQNEAFVRLLPFFGHPEFISGSHISIQEILNQVQDDSVFVPIPLHASKLRKRGYNQAMLLAEGLGQKLDIPVWDCLERIKNTKTQVGLTQKDRVENIKDAFGIKKEQREKVKNMKNVFLVDDVVTSGATLREVAKVLKRDGVAKVWGITLAHGQ